MPEGPEIRRVADQLEKAIKGKVLTDVWFAFPALQPHQQALKGQRVTAIETRGKALLTHFSGGLTLYTHNQLYGLWRIVAGDTIPESTRSLRVKLATEKSMLLLYSASDIALLDAAGLNAHPFLNRVGPDVLDISLTIAQVKSRLLSKQFRRRQLSALLLDQHFLAGLGNYLRVEILWHVGLAATHRADDLSEAQCDALASALLEIPRLSYHTRGKPNEKVHHGAVFRFRIFHRAGKRCERCKGIIEKTVLASRPFYWCPGCQK